MDTTRTSDQEIMLLRDNIQQVKLLEKSTCMWEIQDHPAWYTHLAVSDFHFYKKLKIDLCRRRFETSWTHYSFKQIQPKKFIHHPIIYRNFMYRYKSDYKVKLVSKTHATKYYSTMLNSVEIKVICSKMRR